MKRAFSFPQADGSEIRLEVLIYNKYTGEPINELDDTLTLKPPAIAFSVEAEQVTRKPISLKSVPL